MSNKDLMCPLKFDRSIYIFIYMTECRLQLSSHQFGILSTAIRKEKRRKMQYNALFDRKSEK